MSLAPLSRFRGSRVITAHAYQCCIFQSYAKTVPSRMKLTMILTMREPTFMGSMTTDTWSWRLTLTAYRDGHVYLRVVNSHKMAMFHSIWRKLSHMAFTGQLYMKVWPRHTLFIILPHHKFTKGNIASPLPSRCICLKQVKQTQCYADGLPACLPINRHKRAQFFESPMIS